MGQVVAFPIAGDVFSDVRGDDRTMRVSRHDDQGMVVVSLWAAKQCRASFRLPVSEVSRLVEALGAGAPDDVEPEPEPVKPVKARWWQRFAA